VVITGGGSGIGEVMVEGRESRVWAVRRKDDPDKITTAAIPAEVIAKFG